MQLEYHKTFENFVKNSKHLNKMLIFIDNEKKITPYKENVFRFMSCNLDLLKCIILGMDPYPSTYVKNGNTYTVATGRSFEVANINKWTDKYKQVSLANIFKALWYYKSGKILSMADLRNIDEKDIKYINIHTWFDAMEKSGVMFLNASLTTTIGKSGVHTKIWKDFMDELINYIKLYNENAKWLIWGRNALDRVVNLVDKKNIIYSCHPATRINNTFVKDCCFKYISDVKWL